MQIGEDEGATQFLNELDGDYKGGALAVSPSDGPTSYICALCGGADGEDLLH